MGIRALLVGHDFFNYRTSGDKNYWLTLVPYLQRGVEWIGVLSINHLEEKTSFINTSVDICPIFNITPVYFTTRFGPENKPSGSKCATSYKKPVGAIVDGPLTVIRHIRMIKQLVVEHNIDIIHFMDNFGFAAPILKNYLRNVKVGVTFLNMYSLAKKNLFYKSVVL